MSQLLNAIDFPLHGSRLIEASAGTGKTWTIAALYLRLVLGHGGGDAFTRPLLPSEILVMTFTRAATRELSDRVRARLVEAAACFRGEASPAPHDAFLAALIAAYPDERDRARAAHRLMLAAEGMDEAAIFTIDAWCQRMLREHAFDSGNLFDEELVADEAALLDDAVRDYWRQQVYPLDETALSALLDTFSNVETLQSAVRGLLDKVDLLDETPGTLATLLDDHVRQHREQLAELKQGWVDRADAMFSWLERQLASKKISGSKVRLAWATSWTDALRSWAQDELSAKPAMSESAWHRLTPDGLQEAANKGVELEIPSVFDAVPALQSALAALPELKPQLLSHAAATIARRMARLKREQREYSFADMLTRLDQALDGEHGQTLRARILTQYPVALVDEFQDTAPTQYRIFDRLYRTADNDPQHALLLIGDPKQSIYAFRGADIHSYLAARRATAGRHYLLDTNYRSTHALVDAVNRVFQLADDDASHPRGAFLFRQGGDDPVPFEPVRANGRKETLEQGGAALPALTVWLGQDPYNKEGYLQRYAAQAAEHIVTLLNDATAGFATPDGGFTRLAPADIAVLVRDRSEAAAVRDALAARGVASVYLSDKDSVFQSQEAADLLRWLHAVAAPQDGMLARAALASASVTLPLAELAALIDDDLAWEARVDQLKTLQRVWQRQGVLAMLRGFIHELDLPARLLARPGGERSLTNLLHLAELLQAASLQLDGEQALIRWLAEQIHAGAAAGDELILRLESDADLVKVVTVHKSKGLEYPLVFLPFAVSARPVEKRGRDYLELAGEQGRRIDFALSDQALQQADDARLAEDLRLLYVALTRARHALWLGVAAIGRSLDSNKLHQCALGYLLGGGAPLTPEAVRARLEALRGDDDTIAVDDVAHPSPPPTLLTRAQDAPPLRDAPHYQGGFERRWSVGSFSSLTRDLAAVHVPQHAAQQTLLEDGGTVVDAPAGDAPWHAFPGGSRAGTFLHGELERLAHHGFTAMEQPDYAAGLERRCESAGYGNRWHEVDAWLRTLLATTLPPLDATLAQLAQPMPEMEFWLPSRRLDAAGVDRLCRAHLLPGLPRPALPERTLSGMLKGFADLVFQHGGRYWVLDYKSNRLGHDDDAYHDAALATAVAAHRYDVQGAIYQLALHRLLASRLPGYQPAQHLGGAVFLFLRGVNAANAGCCLLPAVPELLTALEAQLQETTP